MSRRRTGQEGELFEKENWLRRRTGREGELVGKENVKRWSKPDYTNPHAKCFYGTE